MTISSSTGRYTGSLWMTDTTRMQITGTADGSWKAASNEPEQAIEVEMRDVDLSDLEALIGSAEGYEKYRDSVWRLSVERLWPVYLRYPNSRAMLDNLNFYVHVGAVPKEKLQWVYDRLTPENRATLHGQAIALAIDPPHQPQVPGGDDLTVRIFNLLLHAHIQLHAHILRQIPSEDGVQPVDTFHNSQISSPQLILSFRTICPAQREAEAGHGKFSGAHHAV